MVWPVKRDCFQVGGGKIADQCERLLALCESGLTALVDEATGYQYTRAEMLRGNFNTICQKICANGLNFSCEFYYHICRLKVWQYDEENKHKRGISWARLQLSCVMISAPGVKDELKALTPKNAKGRYKNKLFQRLTEGYRPPKT